MKIFIRFFLLAFLAACHGGGGHSPNSCADSGRGCPTGELRGNQTEHSPSDRNNQSRGDPDDRESNSNREPNPDRGGRPSRTAPRASSRQLKIVFGNSGNISTVLLNDVAFDSTERTNEFTHNNDALTYNSLGKELGLSYSDFGTYSIATKNTSIGENNVPFATGEETRLIKVESIDSDLHFAGRAIGTATADDQFVNLDGATTLDFNKKTGVSTLGAKFDNWYDINVQNDKTGTIEFSNYTNANNQVKFDTEDVLTKTGASFTVEYYGITTVTESTGCVKFDDASGIKMDVVFGAKKQ